MSTSELGTYEHPYKELNSVLVELLNFHSHSDRNITIKILEGTTTFLHKNSYILNTTRVTIEPYAKTISLGINPKIIAVDSMGAIVPPGVPTRFNILGKTLYFYYLENTDLLINEKIMDDSSILQEDKEFLNGNSSILFIYKSNFKLNNLFITTQYEWEDSSNYLFQAFEMGFQWFSIDNSHFINEGFIFYTYNFINMDIRNTLFDLYRAKGGFYIHMRCIYSTVLPKTALILDTIKFFFSQGIRYLLSLFENRINALNIERPESITMKDSPFFIFNPQNVSLNNIEYEIYGNLDLSSLVFNLRDLEN